MQERIVKGKSALYRFDSLADIARWLEATPRKWSCDSSQSEGRGNKWDLGAGYQGAWQLARDGWIEGAKQAEEALKAFSPATPQPDTVTDFYGHRPHVARYCAGAPDAMIRFADRADSGGGKVLTLIVSVVANASVSAQCMSNYGIALAQYVNQLETDGTRVELIGSFASDPKRWRVAFTWTIKGADQPLDLALLAFSVGHPAMLRRIGFACYERCAAPTDWGYGGALDTELSDVLNAPAGAIVLNGMREAGWHAQTPEAALAHITAQIEKAQEPRD